MGCVWDTLGALWVGQGASSSKYAPLILRSLVRPGITLLKPKSLKVGFVVAVLHADLHKQPVCVPVRNRHGHKSITVACRHPACDRLCYTSGGGTVGDSKVALAVPVSPHCLDLVLGHPWALPELCQCPAMVLVLALHFPAQFWVVPGLFRLLWWPGLVATIARLVQVLLEPPDSSGSPIWKSQSQSSSPQSPH